MNSKSAYEKAYGSWLIRDLYQLLSHRRRKHFVALLLLMLGSAAFEVVSLGAVVPFLAILADPSGFTSNEYVKPILSFLELENSKQLILLASAFFATAVILATAFRLILVYTSQKFIFGLAKELSIAIFRRTLNQPYAYHLQNNSSATLAAINKSTLVTAQILLPMMQALTASVIAAFILVGLLMIDLKIALVCGFGFAALYLVIVRATGLVISQNGQTITKAHVERLKTANEGTGGIRDIILSNSQETFISRFATTEHSLRKAEALNNFFSHAPRFVVEGIGLLLIAGLTFALSLRDGGLASALPVLGALALGTQRLMPLFQQAYYGWAATRTAGPMLSDILEILALPELQAYSLPDHSVTFKNNITLSDVVFFHKSINQAVLKNISLVIPKGIRIGIIGKTGSGKSTLLNLILGLLLPSGGSVLVDGIEITNANIKAWQARVAHVPQSIYLSDSSIADNIAFGVPHHKINYQRVSFCADLVGLKSFIETLPNKLDTMVGERGTRLSGGQLQRIGIARALYKEAEVIVLDEATSALDSTTEEAIMHSIKQLSRDLTIIIVAHRLSTLDGCDVVVSLDGGRLKHVRGPIETNSLI